MERTTSRQLKITLCGLAAVALMAAAQGCSSSSPASGSGGSNGSAGHGTGGTTGAGIGGTIGAGVGGAVGGGGQRGCTTANTAMPGTNGLIADFAGDGGLGIEIMGGISAYPGASSPSTPMAATTGGTLHITENATPGSAPQYVGAVLYFSGCVDASAFTGVSFSITGTLTGCTMQYSANDSEHGDMTGTDLKATGPSGSYSPQLTVPTPFAATVSVPFTGTGAPANGSPATAIDPAKLIGLQWQFTIPAAPDAGAPTNCVGDINIDNVMFYH